LIHSIGIYDERTRIIKHYPSIYTALKVPIENRG